MIDVYALASCLLVSVYLWVYWCWCVIIICSGYVLLSYAIVITYLFRYVLVYWCGSAGVGWYPNASWCTTGLCVWGGVDGVNGRLK